MSRARSLLRRLEAVASVQPADARQVRAFVEGGKFTAPATRKTADLAEACRAFFLAARHNHKGNAKLRASDDDGT